jgi:hypothetical protein
LPEQKATQLDDNELAELVNRLERNLLARPKDVRPIPKLLTLLDLQSPNTTGNGPYSQCQRALADQFREEDLSKIKTDPQQLIFLLNGWRKTLTGFNVNKKNINSQIHQGQKPTINGQSIRCGSYLDFFNKNNAICGICFSCYKVQILPYTVIDLIRLSFIMKNLTLKRDNSRKCMVDLRDEISYPYKGYIYCESESEASYCLAKLKNELSKSDMPDMYCGISHGCSEYPIAFPEFKFSKDGTHRNFQPPPDWQVLEREFFGTASEPDMQLIHRNNSKITLRDIMCFETWIKYAELIGDESSQLFKEVFVSYPPAAFVERMTRQAPARQAQLAELRQRPSWKSASV